MKRFLLYVLILFLLAGCNTASSAGPLLPSTPLNTLESGLHLKGIVSTEAIFIVLLLLAVLVSLATQRLRIPYTVGLVLVGFGLAIAGRFTEIIISPQLLMALLVPPLVFEAAFYLNFNDFWHDFPLIMTLAVPGVIFTTLLVGGVVFIGTNIPLTIALVFGALIAATDPVAVVALFRQMGIPKRLAVLLEGESLLNDGTAVVLFNIMLGIALTGKFNLGTSLLQFIVSSIGGVAVGGTLGFAVSKFIGKIDNHLVETTLTAVLAYGSYLVAENILGVSGILAVVTAGLISGQIGPKGMSPTTRIVIFNFWEFGAFVANSFIFLIIGLNIDLTLLLENGPAILWAILAVLVARLVVVYGFSHFSKNLPKRWKHVIFWGGLRGAISLALALSLSLDFPQRTQIQAMAFGVVLFTLVVEGLTMSPLIKYFRLVKSSEARYEYERYHALTVAAHAARKRLSQLNNQGLISDYTWHTLKPILEERSRKASEAAQSTLQLEPILHEEEFKDAWREALRAERSSLAVLFRDNIISEDTYSQLVTDVDCLLADPESNWPEINIDLNPD